MFVGGLMALLLVVAGLYGWENGRYAKQISAALKETANLISHLDSRLSLR
ncbi:MAG: hypothetical protein M5U34_40210 [Chloroflexi bacterium]|nr:hypothetical protein [Chloroflexota bacterium]